MSTYGNLARHWSYKTTIIAESWCDDRIQESMVYSLYFAKTDTRFDYVVREARSMMCVIRGMAHIIARRSISDDESLFQRQYVISHDVYIR